MSVYITRFPSPIPEGTEELIIQDQNDLPYPAIKFSCGCVIDRALGPWWKYDEVLPDHFDVETKQFKPCRGSV